MDPNDPPMYVELADWSSFGISVICYVSIAAFMFPLWHRTRHRFCAWFGSGALMSLFISISNQTILRGLTFGTRDYDLIWSATAVLNSLSGLAFLVGFVQLGQHLLRSSSPPVSEPQPSAESA